MTLEDQVRAIVREEIEAREQTDAWLTVEQFGARIGRSPETVRRLVRRGALSGARLVNGREYRIPESAIAAFYESQPEAPVVSVPTVRALGRAR